jgi:nucleotide-binding universal stress UspA family protein
MSSKDRASEVGKDHRIVAGVDGSASSLEAMEWAARQAELTDATLEVVAAWDWPESFGWVAIPNNYNPEEDAQKLLESLIASLGAAHPRLTVSGKVVQGHPAPVLVHESRGADLLVVGSRGHGEFVGMLIGSTSEHCVANAACPVVVIREHSATRSNR